MSLEQSLDDIITDKPRRSGIPEEISGATDKPLLRIKNIHQELTEQDLQELFSKIGNVEFIKFDPENRSVAYCCFESNNDKNNHESVSQFDGKKAMGKILVVEDTRELKDRIKVSQNRGYRQNNRRDRGSGIGRGSRYGGQGQPPRRPNRPNHRNNRPPKKAKKSVEDLDSELNAYMNQ